MGNDAVPLDLAEEQVLLAGVATRLTRMAPTLCALDRSLCTTELYISTVRQEQQGGFGLPAELVAAAAAAGLELSISILVLLPEDDEGE